MGKQYSPEMKQWLFERVKGLSSLVIDEVGDGNINDKSFSKYGFRWSFQNARDAFFKTFGVKVETEELFALCGEFVIEELKDRGIDESVASEFVKRNFGIKVKKNNYVSIETLTIEVAKFLSSGGSFKNVVVKRLPFYEMARSLARRREVQNIQFVDILKEVEDYYFANLSRFEELSLSGLSREDFALVPQVERVPATIQNLTNEVCDYIRAGGKLYGVAAKSLPFFERARSYERFYRKSDELSLETALQDVKNYYFTTIATKEQPEERLSEKDFIYMSMREIEKARTREASIHRLYEMASACSDNNGEVGKAKENPEWSATLSSLECGLTSLEFVALMFPVESNFHIKSGRVHLEKFTIIERDLEEFIERFGSANLLANIKKNDEVLYKRLNNLASTFPEGSISVSELLSFYGYVDDSRSMVVGESINEKSTVEELRQMYEVALDKYFEDESAQFPVDMKMVNKIMNIHLSNSVLYSRLYKLALKKGMTLTNYINGKEIFAFQNIDVDGKIQRVKKQKDGKILPPLTYEIGLDSIKHSLIVIDDGREYTKYLKKKMIVAMFDNRILNDPSLPKEMKINERFKLAQTIMEEVIEEAKTIDEVIELVNSD